MLVSLYICPLLIQATVEWLQNMQQLVYHTGKTSHVATINLLLLCNFVQLLQQPPFNIKGKVADPGKGPGINLLRNLFTI